MAQRPRPIILPTEGTTVNDPLRSAQAGAELMKTFGALAEVKRKAEAEEAALALEQEQKRSIQLNLANLIGKGGQATKKDIAALNLATSGDKGIQDFAFSHLVPEDKPITEKALETKIRVLTEQNPSLSKKIITDVASGVRVVKTDPVTGEHTLINKVTGAVTPLTNTDKGLKLLDENIPSEIPPEDTLFETVEEGTFGATGLVPALLAGASVVTGSVGLPIAEETVAARQTLRVHQQELIRALSINPRFPVAEMEAIKKEINLSPKILDNGPLLQTRMKAVDKGLRVRLQKEKRAAGNSRLPRRTRQDALDAANDIQAFLDILGVPEEDFNVLTPEDQKLLDKYSPR